MLHTHARQWELSKLTNVSSTLGLKLQMLFCIIFFLIKMLTHGLCNLSQMKDQKESMI